MLYNTVGSLIYFACQWFMTVVIVRVSGYELAGILSLAMTVTGAPAIIALFNVRSYQASDIDIKFTSQVYIRSRWISNVLAVIVCLITVIVERYSHSKALTIMLFMGYKAIEGFADVFYGVEQRYERLDLAGISMGIRGILTLGSFTLTDIMTNCVELSIVAVAVVNWATIMVYDYPKVRRFLSIERSENKKTLMKGAIEVIKICIPLAIVAFLNNYSINYLKIVFERYYGSELLAYYSSVASPTLVVQLAATTIFAPLIPILTNFYQNIDARKFSRTIKNFVLLVTALSLICIIGAKILGHWVLTMIFGQGISDYTKYFVPIVFISIMLGVNACLFSVCTLIRELKTQYIIGAVGIITAFLCARSFVSSRGIEGLIMANMLTMLTQIAVQLMLIVRNLKKHFNYKACVEE